MDVSPAPREANAARSASLRAGYRRRTAKVSTGGSVGEIEALMNVVLGFLQVAPGSIIILLVNKAR